MAQPTEKTRWNAKVEAWGIHGALTGLVTRFQANDLDTGALEKALKALAGLAKEVQDRQDAELQRKAEYHQSLIPGGGEMDALRKENEELKRRLMARAE